MVVVMMGSVASGAATVRVDPLNVLLGLAAVAAILTFAAQAWRRFTHQRDQNKQWQRDFYGEPAAQGRPERPGVLDTLALISDKVTTIEAEITPNHGGSIKDAVTRMDVRLEAVEVDLKAVHARLDGPDKVQVNVHT